MTPEEVQAAAAAWVWIPDEASTLETDDFLLVRFPDYFEHPLELVRFTPTGELEPVVDEALARARELGTPRLWWWVRGGEREGLEDLLVARGGELDETLDVLALDLTTAVATSPPAGLELRWQTDPETVRDAHVVTTEVFGGSMPPEDQVPVLADRSAADLQAGLGGTVLAYVDGTPAGAAGLTMADGVARLWGGGVREAHRRQGVYAALLAARLAYAREQDAHLALVKGRVETSGPILRRAGFAAYGRECSYCLPLDAQAS